MIDYDKYIEQIHNTAKEKGWWDSIRTDKTIGVLIIGEISEAIEEIRKDNPSIYQIQNDKGIIYGNDNWDNSIKPEGEAIELIDMLIRLLDFVGYKKDKLREKLNVNKLESIFGYSVEIYYSPFYGGLEFHFNLIDNVIRLIKEEGFIKGKFDTTIFPKNLHQILKNIEYYFEKNNWNLEELLKLKMYYNESRSYRHGNKKY